MPQNFIECDREQELLPDDHLAWSVADAVERFSGYTGDGRSETYARLERVLAELGRRAATQSDG
jgi:hypothetical protein